ncbi:MAG: exodeoxyribonuclease VII large subunit [Ruminococcus sp.]
MPQVWRSMVLAKARRKTVAILSVSQLNRYVGFKLKRIVRCKASWCVARSPISPTTTGRGHLYFTLRDAESCVKAVMFRSNAQRLRFTPREGMNVIAAATASLYERDGAFQLCDRSPAGRRWHTGVGAGTAQEKLTAMGVFDAAAKRPLPAMPQRSASLLRTPVRRFRT